jgi:hypothetical protein
MKSYQSNQVIGQLEKRKGGYFFLKIEADIINQFQNKRYTRFLCTLEGHLAFQCGLNHLGKSVILSIKLQGLKTLINKFKKAFNLSKIALNQDPKRHENLH